MTKNFKKLTALILCFALLCSGAAVSVFANTDAASSFATAVSYIENASTLTEKEEHLISAESYLEAYKLAGGSETDAEISASYEKYVVLKGQIEETIGYCEQFMEYVDFAIYESDTFAETMEYIELAETLLDKIDLTYSGMRSAKADYDNLILSYREPIDICESYISNAKAAAEATVYKDALKYYETAMLLKKNITIEDYPGLDEADANLDIATSFMSECILKAQNFILAVENINKAESVAIGIEEAYEIFERDGVDGTAEGAAAALSELKLLEKNYNRTVSRANEQVEDINAMIFAFIF